MKGAYQIRVKNNRNSYSFELRRNITILRGESGRGTIIVIDEDSQFIRSKDFARVLRESDNFFLLITRNYLAELPISVDEIYELNGAKNKKFKKVYQDIET